MSFNAGGGGIANANDVALSNPADGQALTYNSTVAKWQNVAIPVTSVASKTGAVTLAATDVGLGNVDNTSDANKPISTATQTALSGKVSTATTVNGHALSANVTVTKSDVGLANVDNTSDANKPVSTATQAALSTKLSDISGLVTQGTNVAISGAGTAASPYVISSSGSGGSAAAWGSITGTLSAQADLQAALDSNVRLDQDFFVTGDGSAGITHATPGIGLGVETTGNSNAHIEINSPTGGVAYMDFTTVNVDYAMRMGWYDTDGQFKFANAGGALLTLNGSGNLVATGTVTGSNLSGTNTGDQTLGSFGITASATELNYTTGVTSALQTQLNNKLPVKNGNPQLTDSTNDKFARIDITNDGTATSGWPDRLAFYYAGVRTGYHNEYGELRARPAKANTVPLRAMAYSTGSSGNLFEVAQSTEGSTLYFGVSQTAASLGVPLSSTANITTTGTVSGSNIGAKVTASSTAPSSPAVGDVWVDLSA